LGENNRGGEVVQFTTKEELNSSIRCPDLSGYAIRDPSTLKGSLALLTSSLIAQRKVDLFQKVFQRQLGNDSFLARNRCMLSSLSEMAL
jgi:hypothetical protein